MKASNFCFVVISYLLFLCLYLLLSFKKQHTTITVVPAIIAIAVIASIICIIIRLLF